MKKIYNPKNIEQFLYRNWEEKGYFKPNDNERKEPFCIMIPPPNITGSLHIGHAFQYTIIDIMIRYQRMQGKNTLCQVGTDHAGIATQMIVERKIAIEEKKTRYDYDRNEFINKVWQWKIESSKNISNQMRRLGISVDWNRERFSMDENFINAVKKAFVYLYKNGLIYRGKRLVNWDPKLQTAISNLEVENRELKGSIWYIRYPLANGIKTFNDKNYLTIATTRPETILADTGIAVNPKDPRYKDLIGKFVISPLVNRYIPIIGDSYANIEKGTGCVKITPAHDFNDYEVGRRHALPMINILTYNGSIRTRAQVFDAEGNKSNIYSNKIPKQFQKLERFVARKAIIFAINNLGLLEKTELQTITIPYSDRGDVIIEPMLTDQWFLRTNMLVKPAIEAIKKGSIRFVSKQYENMYFSWMNNIKDWCISRQLWWGHRIPAWYDKQGNIYVEHNLEEVYQKNNINTEIKLLQDNNVLDTWFSSSLWTFSTLGWPKNTKSLLKFHPTNVIVSGFDIIYFWIARMIMMTMYFIKDEYGNPQIPFKVIYMTGLIRDSQGEKMSKSKGNVIDPLDIIDGISLPELLIKRTNNMMQPQLANKIYKYTKEQFPNGIRSYGADALRFTLAAIGSTNRDIVWDMKRLEGYRNFCNKLWNASRFVLINTENKDCGFNNNEKILSLADRWILSKFNQTIKNYRKALDNYRFDLAASILYEFTWNQFCDWYLELTKTVINNGNEIELRGTRNTLVVVLEALLRLAHIIIPFITETIWQSIKVIIGINADTIMLQPFPEYNESQIDEKISFDIEWLKQTITTIRNIRAENKVMPGKRIELILRNCKNFVVRLVNENHKFIKNMAYLKNITILANNSKKIPIASISKVIDGAELIIPLVDVFDKINELNRLAKELEKVEKEILCIKNKIENTNFIARAPKLVVNKTLNKLASCIETKAKITKQQADIRSIV